MCVCVRLWIGSIDQLELREEGRKIRPAGRWLRRLVLCRDVVLDFYQSVFTRLYMVSSAFYLRNPTSLRCTQLRCDVQRVPQKRLMMLPRERVVIGCLRNWLVRSESLARGSTWPSASAQVHSPHPANTHKLSCVRATRAARCLTYT